MTVVAILVTHFLPTPPKPRETQKSKRTPSFKQHLSANQAQSCDPSKKKKKKKSKIDMLSCPGGQVYDPRINLAGLATALSGFSHTLPSETSLFKKIFLMEEK